MGSLGVGRGADRISKLLADDPRNNVFKIPSSARCQMTMKELGLGLGLNLADSTALLVNSANIIMLPPPEGGGIKR